MRTSLHGLEVVVLSHYWLKGYSDGTAIPSEDGKLGSVVNDVRLVPGQLCAKYFCITCHELEGRGGEGRGEEGRG